MKRHYLILLATIVSMVANAQQWELDFGDPESYIVMRSGIVNGDGDAVLVGNIGPDKNHYFPMIMRVTEEGEYEYRVFDSIVGNMKPTSIIQQGNGNYFVSAVVNPNVLGVGEDVVFLVFDSDFNILHVKSYEKPEIVTGMRGGQLMLDDDGTVVFSCAYWYKDGTEPCFYRFDANADTLSCNFVLETVPPRYDCYQLLQNPNDDGFVVLCGTSNGCQLLTYDYDFNYEDGFVLSPAFRQRFMRAYSNRWLSDNSLLIMGDMWPSEECADVAIGMAEVNLDGTFGHWDRVYHKQDSTIQESNQCMAYVNDSTIYGGAWFYEALSGERYASVCLYDTDMEMLGRREFVEPEYGNYSSCVCILPMEDGGCLVSTFVASSYPCSYASCKLIKLSREDLNPIPCRVKEVSPETITAHAFPNPATSELNIDISGLPENKTHRIQVTDGNGRCCLNRIIRGRGNVFVLDVSCFRAGLYTYSIYNDEKDMIRGKFVKE